MKRDAIVNVRLPEDLKRALGRAADDDHGRSLSGMVVRVLEEWLSAAGYVDSKGGFTARNAPTKPKKKRR